MNTHEKFKEYGKKALEYRRKCEMLLPEIFKFEIWREKGFLSIYEYAAKLAGMSQHTLQTYVKEFRNESVPKVEVDVNMKLKLEVLKQLEKMRGELTWNDLMEKLLSPDAPEAIEASSRHVPNEMQRFAKGKFNGKCHYPNCSRPGEILHHTQRFALERVHDPARLVYLCKAHEQIAHLGLFDNEEDAPHSWRLREEADKSDVKYFVDRKVQGYRSSHKIFR